MGAEFKLCCLQHWPIEREGPKEQTKMALLLRYLAAEKLNGSLG